MSDLRSSLWLADQLGKKSWAKSGTRLWQKPLYQGASQARAAVPFLKSFAAGVLPQIAAVAAPLFIGGSTDQKNRWSRLGYSSEEDYNNAIAAHKADQAANPENYDPKALQYQAEFDAEGDKPFLNKVFSNLFSKAEDNKVTQSVPSPADIIAFTEDTGRTAAEAEQILGGGLETVFDGPTAKEQWLAKTANSPAQQSGAWSTPEGKEQLWQQHLMHQDWKEARKSGTLDDFAAKYPQSQTAKERAIRNKIPTSMDMEF